MAVALFSVDGRTLGARDDEAGYVNYEHSRRADLSKPSQIMRVDRLGRRGERRTRRRAAGAALIKYG